MTCQNYPKLGKDHFGCMGGQGLKPIAHKKIYIKFGFRFCGTHPLNPKAMEPRIDLSYIYTTLATSEGEEDYNSNDEVEENQHWKKIYNTTKLLNIKNNPTTLRSQPIWHYMDMIHSSIVKPSL